MKRNHKKKARPVAEVVSDMLVTDIRSGSGSSLFFWHLYGGYLLADPTDPQSDALWSATCMGPTTIPPNGRTMIGGELVKEFVVQLPDGGQAGYVCTFDHDPSEQEERAALARFRDVELRGMTS